MRQNIKVFNKKKKKQKKEPQSSLDLGQHKDIFPQRG